MNIDKIRFKHTHKATLAPTAHVRPTGKVCTYIAYNPHTRLTKIGRSTNERSRLIRINNMHGTRLRLIALFNKDIERILHNKYQDRAKGNEWFDLTDPQLLMLKRMAEQAMKGEGGSLI